MIVLVCGRNMEDAVRMYSELWSGDTQIELMHIQHRIEEKIAAGSVIFMLYEGGTPAGIVSVTGALIEDMYIVPELRGSGLGERLLKVAMSRCTGKPTLWAPENAAELA